MDAAFGALCVRYYVGMTISKNGKPRPIEKSHRLCKRNDRHYSSKAREVKLLRDAFMLTVNAPQANAVADLSDFEAMWRT